MRRKGIKQLEVRTFPNVFTGRELQLQQKIFRYFGNTNPVTLELGCGNGEYSIALAEKYPGRNFVGVDIKGSRIWTGAKLALEKHITNAAFIISYIDRLKLNFTEPFVEEIWIPFPNPFQKQRSVKQRLVHSRYLEIYRKILLPGAKIHLKTDDETLFDYTLRVIDEKNLVLHSAFDDLHNHPDNEGEEKIITKYENQHLNDGKKIKYISFGFSS